MKNKKLYAWQKECLAAWEENRFRGIINVVTGAGKTYLALAAIERARDLYPDIMVRIVGDGASASGRFGKMEAGVFRRRKKGRS